MSRIMVCDRCGKTAQGKKFACIKRLRCKWVGLEISPVMGYEHTDHLCEDCAQAFKRFMSQKEDT